MLSDFRNCFSLERCSLSFIVAGIVPVGALPGSALLGALGKRAWCPPSLLCLAHAVSDAFPTLDAGVFGRVSGLEVCGQWNAGFLRQEVFLPADSDPALCKESSGTPASPLWHSGRLH